MTQTTNVATYHRMSTKKREQELSIDQQRDECERYARANGLEITREYVDAGITGRRADREAWERMRADAAGGEFSAILTWKLDRFSRLKANRFFVECDTLIEAGVRLFSVVEGEQDWHTEEGLLMLCIRIFGSSKYSPDLSRAVARGMLAAARAGYWLGVAPYGYKVVGPERQRVLEIDPGVMPYAVEGFTRYARGEVSLRGLAVSFNDRGIPTSHTLSLRRRTGDPDAVATLWTPTSVMKVLRNPVYVGVRRWNVTNRSEMHTIKNGKSEPRPRTSKGTARNPEEDWVRLPRDEKLRAIDDATFERVQRRLVERQQARTPHKENPFALSGLVICGRCGGRMHAQAGRRGRSNFYSCASYNLHGRSKCVPRWVTEPELLGFVIGTVCEQLLAPEKRFAWVAEVERHLTEACRSDPAEVARLKGEVKALDKKIDRANENLAVLPKDRLPGVVAKVRAWEKERAASAGRLAALEGAAVPPERIKAVTRGVLRAMEGFHAALTGADPAEQLRVVREVVAKVTVHDADFGGWIGGGKASDFGYSVSLRPDTFLVRHLVPEMLTLVSRN
jgi:DNA invertase Pin-like site-specific DNA recombinase